MTLKAECASASEALARLTSPRRLRAVTKLGGAVDLVAPASLPNDGKVIADERKPACAIQNSCERDRSPRPAARGVISANIGSDRIRPWSRCALGNCSGRCLKPAIGGEKRQRGRIIDRGLHAVGVQMRRQRIAARMLDRIEMIDVAAVRRDLRAPRHPRSG